MPKLEELSDSEEDDDKDDEDCSAPDCHQNYQNKNHNGDFELNKDAIDELLERG